MGSRIYVRNENFIKYTENSTVTVDLSRNYHVGSYTLKLTANITNAASSVSYNTDNLFALINKITLKANGSILFKAVKGEKLIFNSIIKKGMIGYSNLVKTANTTNNCTQVAEIYLNLPDTVRPWDTILNTALFDTYQIEIQWGDGTNLGTGITVNNAKLEIISNQEIGYKRAVNEEIIYYKENLLKTENITNDNTALQITIPIKHFYKGILLVSKTNNKLSNEIINNIICKSGTVIFLDVAANFLQAQNALTARKNNDTDNKGLYYIDFTPRGFLSDLLNTETGAFNTVELVLDVSTAANAYIDIYTEYIERTGQFEK